MDAFTMAQIQLTNLLSEAVRLHDYVGHNVDRMVEEVSEGQLKTSLDQAGPNFKRLTDLYKEVRDASVVFEYLAGHDVYTIANDFKISHGTIKAILAKVDIIIPSKPRRGS